MALTKIITKVKQGYIEQLSFCSVLSQRTRGRFAKSCLPFLRLPPELLSLRSSQSTPCRCTLWCSYSGGFYNDNAFDHHVNSSFRPRLLFLLSPPKTPSFWGPGECVIMALRQYFINYIVLQFAPC